MKNDFLKNSSQRVLFSALMASALAIGNLAPMHAEVASVQSVMQSVSVKGQVLDGDGIPVIGASILEKGTTNGVITDIDGNYSLNVSSKNAVIVISYIGYKTVELKASDPGLPGQMYAPFPFRCPARGRPERRNSPAFRPILNGGSV